jgi:hypothetical protein
VPLYSMLQSVVNSVVIIQRQLFDRRKTTEDCMYDVYLVRLNNILKDLEQLRNDVRDREMNSKRIAIPTV